ncbi:MAG TPA: TIGR01777 family oxidoreductase [Intrasporangium sp.]|uniref:TIGR01777 family oxidoreductase n=1 Tax=Intrasporangium sp. TaxID=1925024 RepID=UPI002D7911D5|nr:TIGR01777 family oxidoreductase [Intrasporangium sp.]HET7397480.1 TIGR01777 family oxidoreductase [Intrasporangium sp.]
MTKRVAVAGSSGLIGGALRRLLADRGDEVLRLVRRPAQAPDEVAWDPEAGRLDPASLERVDAVVNLAGVGIGDHRWSAEHKRAVERSRVAATGTISQALVSVLETTGRRVRLVNGSAVGFYGDRGDEVLTEASPAGTDFLAGLVTRWEAATAPAAEAGLSVATARTGLVMAADGGAFAPLLRVTRLGLGGPLGSGRQYWPWITLADEARALAHLIDRTDLTGPVNLVSPSPAPQKDIARALGRALSRPAVLPAPRFAMRAIVGELADSIVASQRVTPFRLAGSGFAFEHADLDGAVRWLVGR